MKLRFIKRIALALIIVQLSSVFFLEMGNVNAETQRTIRIVDYATGLDHIDLGNETQPMPQGGYPFAVKILLNGATANVADWQITVTFDNNSLRCTNILIPEADPTYIFSGKQEVPISDFSNESQDAVYGGKPSVIASAGLLYPDQPANVSSNALLCMMNFTARKIGSFNLSFLGVTDYSATFLLDPNQTPLPQLGQPYAVSGLSIGVVAALSNPVAAFTVSPPNPTVNQTVTFDASTSYDPSGEFIQTYKWDFGDNATTTTNSTLTVARHMYSANGLYVVNLTVVNTDNFTGSTAKQLQVGSVPTAVFTYLPLGVILPADQVIFNASESAAPNSTIVSYLWDFGDNSTTAANDTVISHSYSRRGVYNVILTVTDSDGLFNLTVTELQVGKPPVPLFTWTPQFPMVGDDVTFSSQATSDTGVSITAYMWDFGGVTGIENGSAIMIRSYPAADNFTVTLAVYDSDGLHTSYNQTVSVTSVESGGQLVDYTTQIVAAVIVVLIAVALVVRRLRRKKEEILEI